MRTTSTMIRCMFSTCPTYAVAPHGSQWLLNGKSCMGVEDTVLDEPDKNSTLRQGTVPLQRKTTGYIGFGASSTTRRWSLAFPALIFPRLWRKLHHFEVECHTTRRRGCEHRSIRAKKFHLPPETPCTIHISKTQRRAQDRFSSNCRGLMMRATVKLDGEQYERNTMCTYGWMQNRRSGSATGCQKAHGHVNFCHVQVCRWS